MREFCWRKRGNAREGAVLDAEPLDVVARERVFGAGGDACRFGTLRNQGYAGIADKGAPTLRIDMGCLVGAGLHAGAAAGTEATVDGNRTCFDVFREGARRTRLDAGWNRALLTAERKIIGKHERGAGTVFSLRPNASVTRHDSTPHYRTLESALDTACVYARLAPDAAQCVEKESILHVAFLSVSASISPRTILACRPRRLTITVMI